MCLIGSLIQQFTRKFYKKGLVQEKGRIGGPKLSCLKNGYSKKCLHKIEKISNKLFSYLTVHFLM